MKKLKMLLASLAISGMALLPLVNSARAQVVVYNHGHPVRVAHAAKKEWSKVKSGARTGYRKAANATTREWSKAKSGARTGYRKAANATTKEWSNVKSGVRTETYRLKHGDNDPAVHHHPTSYSSNYQISQHRERLYRARLRDARIMRERRMREQLYRARLMREQMRREAQYRARLERQR